MRRDNGEKVKAMAGSLTCAGSLEFQYYRSISLA